MNDSNKLPEFPVYGDGFSNFTGASTSESTSMTAYVPDERDVHNTIKIKHSHKLLASASRFEKDLQAARPVIKKQTKRRKSEQSTARANKASRNDSDEEYVPRRSARIRRNETNTAGQYEEEERDEDDDFM